MNNDFHKTHDIFDLFKGLVLKDIDTEVSGTQQATEPAENGTHSEAPASKTEKQAVFAN